jgi:hypothetical protein
MDVNFQAELEEVFKQTFLENAPLYVAAPKVRLPYEDIKKSTTLYRGSLSEQVRTVEEIADYHIFKEGWPGNQKAAAKFIDMAREAAQCVEGLIRLENSRHDPDHDVRSPTTRVIDIFEHKDGRRNFQPIAVDATKEAWNPADPFNQIHAWVAYRFYFAAANVRTEYKASKAAPHNTTTK